MTDDAAPDETEVSRHAPRERDDDTVVRRRAPRDDDRTELGSRPPASPSTAFRGTEVDDATYDAATRRVRGDRGDRAHDPAITAARPLDRTARVPEPDRDRRPPRGPDPVVVRRSPAAAPVIEPLPGGRRTPVRVRERRRSLVIFGAFAAAGAAALVTVVALLVL